MPQAAAHELYRFEEFTLDLARGSLRSADRSHELRPKSFEVLRYLVEHADRIVTKDELLAAVWPNVTVTEDSLTRCISEVRAALGDSEQRLIKTVPRKGYILRALVIAAEHNNASTHISRGDDRNGASSAWRRLIHAVPARQVRWVWVAVAAVVLLASAATVIFQSGRSSVSFPTERASVAVLPFLNLGGDPRQDYLADGISEEIITGLSKFAELLVIADTSSATYKGRTSDTKQIGREMSVRYLVHGSVRREGGRIRVIVQLVDATLGAQIWAQQYDRDLASLIAVQDEVAQSIVGILVAHVSKSELARVMRKPPQTFAAYDYFLRGRAMLKDIYRRERGEVLAEARSLFEASLSADPAYAPAMQALAYTYALIYLEPTAYAATNREYAKQDTITRALELGQRAIELDRTLSEAHSTLGWILHWHYRRAESLASFARALELNPNLADGRYSLVLTHNGRADEGIEMMKRVMRLDPFHTPVYFTWLGNAYYMTGQYGEASRNLMTAASRLTVHRPTRVWLAAAAAQIGNGEVASKAVADVLKQEPDFTIKRWLELLRLVKQTDADRLADGMRKAGFAE
jgi:TolB-like protein/DNA-binding winged helix-turn-helix (wHTH) protein/Tfp pilus assembly protein PilF